jgi:DNA primase large subunit
LPECGALTRIRAIETLAKISRDEHELSLRQAEQATNLQQEIAEVAKISPELAEEYAKSKGVNWTASGVANDTE